MKIRGLNVPRADHVVFGDNSMRCNHCGVEQKLAFPNGGLSMGSFTGLFAGFSHEHKACKLDSSKVAERRKFTTPWEWVERSQDTGTSSRTICQVLGGVGIDDGRTGIPYDPSDFGRCIRLVRAFPGWRERLPEVAARVPKWAPFVREWDRMATLFDEEFPTGKAPKLYEFMQTLRKEVEPC